jgi:pimeloyl-ACP methyl ester carboxylesterase
VRRHGSSDRAGHGLTALGVGLALLGSLGVTQAIARPAPSAGDSGPAAHGDFAGRVDIGGRSLYMECRGRGRPTVILEAGLRSRGDFWSVAQDPATNPATVLDGVAQFTRVCEYDRPGTTLGVDELSRSDPVPMPRTARQATADLHALLRAAGVHGPYVLAGHSTGGLFVQLYARRYPGQVVGLVLVEALAEKLESAFSPDEWALFKRLNTDPPPGLEEYADLETVVLLGAARARVRHQLQLRRARRKQPLREIPLTVISRTVASELPAVVPPGYPRDVRARVADRPACARQPAPAQPACVRGAQRAVRDARSAATGDQGDPARRRCSRGPIGCLERI